MPRWRLSGVVSCGRRCCLPGRRRDAVAIIRWPPALPGDGPLSVRHGKNCRALTCTLELAGGLEPPTCCLQDSCAAGCATPAGGEKGT